MSTKKTELSSILAEIAVKGVQEKKAKSVVKIDLRNLSSAVADYFIICHAESNTQIEAIAGAVEEEVRNAIKEKPFSREGFSNAEWIIIDYVNVVVHIFLGEKRQFYAIEKLWADGKITEYQD